MRLALLLVATAFTCEAHASSLADKSDRYLLEMKAKIDQIITSRKAARHRHVNSAAANESVTAPAPIGSSPIMPSVERRPPQNLFIRSDPLDGLALPFDYPYLMDGKGASISFSGNQITNTQTLNANAFLALRGNPIKNGDLLLGYGAFTYVNGTLNNPPRLATERNALQAGVDLQAAYSGGDYSSLLVGGLRPYFQTDFRGYAQIGGFSLTFEPYRMNELNLGGRAAALVTGPQYVSWYWRILPELNYFHVGDQGQTSFRPNRDYAFLGGTVQLRTLLFDGIGPGWLSSRFYFNGSVTQFWNIAARGKEFHDSQIEFGYLISKGQPIDPNIPLVASISAVYNNGTNRLTFVKRDEYKVQLNLQY